MTMLTFIHISLIIFQHGNAAIHEAAWNGFSKTLELLVKHNVNVAATNKVKFQAHVLFFEL